jgi:hypothetical protein
MTLSYLTFRTNCSDSVTRWGENDDFNNECNKWIIIIPISTVVVMVLLLLVLLLLLVVVVAQERQRS